MTNPFRSILDAQRENFFSNATKSWRIDQLDRMERMLTDNRTRSEKCYSVDVVL